MRALAAAILLFASPAGIARADSGVRTGSVSITLDQRPFTVDFSYPAGFDPAKPTIVFVQGGPMPFEQKRPLPNLLSGAQVIAVNYVGATRSDQNIPGFSPAETLKDFTSDNEAKVIAAVVKKENLQDYILWGQSHGVQLSLRAIDAIQRDPTIAVKPVAAVLDSGMGRQITEADLAAKASLGTAGPHGKCIPPGSQTPSPSAIGANAPQYPDLDQPNIDGYISICGYNFPNPDYKTALVNDLKEFSQSDTLLKLLGPHPSPQAIKNVFGCPAFDKINMEDWSSAITCGAFQKDALISLCQSSAPPQYKSGCANQPPCYESPLDVARYKLGKTAILGIQSTDDCTNWTGSMDYLMSHLGTAPGAYVKVTHAGGHVTFPDTDAWAACLSPATQAKLSSALFSGNASAAKTLLLGCYRGSSDASSDAAASQVTPAR